MLRRKVDYLITDQLEKAKAITSNYNISIISEQDPNKILTSIKNILSDKVSKLES